MGVQEVQRQIRGSCIEFIGPGRAGECRGGSLDGLPGGQWILRQPVGAQRGQRGFDDDHVPIWITIADDRGHLPAQDGLHRQALHGGDVLMGPEGKIHSLVTIVFAWMWRLEGFGDDPNEFLEIKSLQRRADLGNHLCGSDCGWQGRRGWGGCYG